jgi:hypothetical protein
LGHFGHFGHFSHFSHFSATFLVTLTKAEMLEPPTVMNVTAVLLDMPPEVRSNVDRARSETVTKLWQVTERMNILYPENWTRIAAEELLWFQDQLSKALTQEFHTRIRTQVKKSP